MPIFKRPDLYEYGSIPLLVTHGKKKEIQTGTGVSTGCGIKSLLDERIEDGLYAAGALRQLKDRLEEPSVAQAAVLESVR